MQDRYVGDIGDYAKLALLRALSPGRRLGIAWWRYPDENHTGDGRHIDYLGHPSQWRHLDPELFDGLGRVVRVGDRKLSALQGAGLLEGAVFCDEVMPTGLSAVRLRAAREAWFERTRARLSECDLVFVDPDNGLEPGGYSLGAISGGKCVSLAQLRALSAPGRTLVVYHHQTRRKGGHLAELDYWTERLRREAFERVDVVRAKPYSPRAFFLLDAPEDLRRRAERLASHWGVRMSWHPGPEKGATADASSSMPRGPRGLLARLWTLLRPA